MINKEEIKEKQSGILYMEQLPVGMKLRIYFPMRHAEMKGNLRNIKKVLDERFITYKDGGIVNTDHIVHVDRKNKTIQLVTGEVIECGVLHMFKFRKLANKIKEENALI